MKKQYRKKPIVIEAIQWNGTTHGHIAIDIFMGIFPNKSAVSDGHANTLLIPTLEGVMEASVGDYIIKGVAGEFYPCKPDIFEKTYEEVQP